MRKTLWMFLAMVGSAAISACGGGGSPIRSYVDLLGTDTLFVETYERTADGFRGMLLSRNPVTRLAKYEGTLREDGTVASFEVGWETPSENPDGAPSIHTVVTFDGDSATIERHAPDGGETIRVAAPYGTIPMVGKTPYAYAVLEQSLAQGEGSDVQILNLSRGTVQTISFTLDSPGTFTYSLFGSPLLILAENSGRITGISGKRTTMDIEGALADAADVEALAAEFAQRDARGEGLGVPSPPGEASLTLNGALLSISYSRPAKRGREIFGGLVPYDEVWRTGANAATSFSTTRDISFGGQTLPAGDYTLFSVYTEDSATLIINGQTGQWGTAYDESQDVMRVPMEFERAQDEIERFTISLEEQTGGGVIVLVWDTSMYFVPFSVN
ncbi:MAG: DUF2911 domain-containing protein [Gemmatimonadota bacterium]|nr:DUF2911 domain-containing protein [Gemmatimonadota bacterium]